MGLTVMKRLKRLVSLSTAFCVLAAAFAFCSPKTAAIGELSRVNSQPRHQICTALSDEAKFYYVGDYSYDNLSRLSGANDVSSSAEAMRGNELFSKLHTLMSETHSYFTSYSGYSKGSLAYFWNSTDAVSDGDSYIMFYSDVLKDDSVKLNREHVWPKSRASFYQKNGGSDLHHLRPSVSTVNLAKSDHIFGYINGTFSDDFKEGKLGDNIVYYVNGKQDLFECKDDVKGDVARILLYVYCRWEQPNLYTAVSDNLPEPDSDNAANSGNKVVESLDTLLQWCELDPVDTWEMERNDLVEEVQGNRNVFIDYPELAWQMFSRELPKGMATPTHIGCEHNYTEISRTAADYDSDGCFTLRCENCGNEYTRRLAKLGASERVLGDTNGDGVVNINDATCIQRKLVGFKNVSFDEKVSDVNSDGAVNIYDVTYIQLWLCGYLPNSKIGSRTEVK